MDSKQQTAISPWWEFTKGKGIGNLAKTAVETEKRSSLNVVDDLILIVVVAL